MELRKQFIDLKVGDGSTMQAYTVSPAGDGPFPALMVFQEAFGVNDHIQSVCDRFASEGYFCISPEFYHRTAAPGFTGAYSDFPALAPHFSALNDGNLSLDLEATFAYLQSSKLVVENRIACTGYCMGGRVSFLANTLFDLKCAVSYYGGRIVPDLIKKAGELHGPMLFFWGGLDKHIGADQINAVTAALKAANKDFTNVEISYADHGFSCDARPAYNKMAATQAWALTLAFLKLHV